MKLTAEATVLNDNKLNTNIDNAQSTANTATTKADNAQTTANEAKSIATDTAQYFWFTSSGSDTGAHISEKTKAQFEASPSGGNLLANSNGIAVREGVTELSTFSADTVELGKNSDTATIKMCADSLNISGEYSTFLTQNDTYKCKINNNNVQSNVTAFDIENSNENYLHLLTTSWGDKSFDMYCVGDPYGCCVTGEIANSGNFSHVFVSAGDAYVDVRSGSDGDDGSITVPHININGMLNVPDGSIKNAYAYSDTVGSATNMYIGTTGLIHRTTNTSSRRYKHDIKAVEDKALDPHNLYDVEVVQFKYNEGVLTNKSDARYDKTLIGFISEQVKEHYPIAVDINEDGECEAWNSQYVIPPMLKLIQEQHTEIEMLKDRISELERRSNEK